MKEILARNPSVFCPLRYSYKVSKIGKGIIKWELLGMLTNESHFYISCKIVPLIWILLSMILFPCTSNFRLKWRQIYPAFLVLIFFLMLSKKWFWKINERLYPWFFIKYVHCMNFFKFLCKEKYALTVWTNSLEITWQNFHEEFWSQFFLKYESKNYVIDWLLNIHIYTSVISLSFNYTYVPKRENHFC